MSTTKDETPVYTETTLPKRPPPTSKIRRVFALITLEPMVMLYILAYMVTTLTTQNLNLEKACRVNLRLSPTICDALRARGDPTLKAQEVQVQKVVASAYVWKFALQSAFAVVILAFVGSWSDRNRRRKPCLIAPMLGEICTTTCLILCTYFFNQLPLEANIVSELISCCVSGGINVFVVGVFTLICSRTTVEGRTVRVGVIHVLIQLGATVGLASSGILIQKVGFLGVYGTTLVLHVLALAYGIFFVKEEEREEAKKPRTVGFIKDFFNLESLRSALKVVFRNKDKARQKRIHLIMIVAMLVVGPMHGELGVLYLYTRYKFEWNEVDFSIFFSCCAIIHLAAAAVSLFVFSKWLKMDDALIGCIAAISKIAGSLVYAFAPSGKVFYFGIAADVLSSILFITMRSIVTKQVGAAELGKMNAIFGLAEALVPFIYGPLYSATYRWTIAVFPGTFYVISAVMTLPVCAIYLWLHLNRLPNLPDDPEDVEKCEKLLVQ